MMRPKNIFIVIVLYYLAIPNFAHAYIDPGTGSYIVQVVLGVLLAGVLSVKGWWKNIIFFIKKRQNTKNNKSDHNGNIKEQY